MRKKKTEEKGVFGTCNYAIWAYPLVVSQGWSSSSHREMGLLVLCVPELSPQLLFVNFSSSPPWFFQWEQLSGGGLSSMISMESFLALVRADVLQKQPWCLSLASGYFISMSMFYFCCWMMRQFQGKKCNNFQAVQKTKFKFVIFSTWAKKHSARPNNLNGEVRFPWEEVFSQASNLELSGLFSTLFIWEGLSFHRSHASWLAMRNILM